MTCYIAPVCVNTLGVCNSSYGTCVLCCLFLFCVVCSILSREMYGFIFPWKILWSADTGMT